MTTRILTGSKQEIAEQLANLDGDVREAIVFIAEPQVAKNATSTPASDDDFFTELDALAANIDQFNDSREAIYTRLESE